MQSLRKLTIAIPTFNRYTDLRITLGAIKKQLSKLDYKIASLIHIHVQDNDSNDNTSKYLINSPIASDIKKTGALFTYKKNSMNLGFDKNFALCIDNSLSEYTWIFSDDDIIYEDVIEKVLIILKDNISMVNLLMEQIPFCSKEKPLRIDSYSEKYLSGKSFEALMSFSKLSVFIFNTEIAKKILANLDPTMFIHIELALGIALNSKIKCLYSNLFIGEDNIHFTNKTNDWSPYIFNNRYLMVKRLLNDFRRDDLISILDFKFKNITDPIVITLKLLIFKNLDMHNVKKSVLDDCKRWLSSQKYFIKYTNIPLYFLYFSGLISSYAISILIKFIDLIKFCTFRIFFIFCNNNRISSLILKKREIFPRYEFLKRVKKPNIILLVGKYHKEDLFNSFKDDTFRDSELLVLNNIKIDNSENLNNRKIKFSESNHLERNKNDFYNIEDYLLDIKKISRIDLLCINYDNLQFEVFKEFKSLVRFTNFIVIDFSSIINTNIQQISCIIKTLRDNNHNVYAQSKVGLIPISNFRIKPCKYPIKIISILRA